MVRKFMPPDVLVEAENVMPEAAELVAAYVSKSFVEAPGLTMA